MQDGLKKEIISENQLEQVSGGTVSTVPWSWSNLPDPVEPPEDEAENQLVNDHRRV